MSDLHDDFLRRFMAAQHSLYAYIRSHGIGPTDSDDLMQTLALELWKTYSAFDTSRPFSAWSFGIARNLISKRHRSKSRNAVMANSEICDQIADRVAGTLVDEETRLAMERTLLEECLKALAQHARELISLRYEKNLNLAAIAARVGKSAAATNMLLSRIRAKLMDCVSARAAGT